MMLDPKATFDEVVRKHAPDEETREQILENRIYQRQLSNALAGSQEYMAMEKLFEIWAEGSSTCLSSTRHRRGTAARLPRSAKRLTSSSRAGRYVFMAPTGIAARSRAVGPPAMFSILKGITGVDLLQDLAEFFQAMSGMVSGFRERARRVNELLADSQSMFLVVCGPQGEPIDEAVYYRKLVEAKLPFGGVIVGKVHYADEASAGAAAADRPARGRGSGPARGFQLRGLPRPCGA